MAELILTEEEKAAPSYLDFDDAALGKTVRHLAVLYNDTYGKQAVWAQMAGHILRAAAQEMNGTEMTLSLVGCTTKGVDVGDWEVVVRRTAPPAQEKQNVR